MLLVSYDITSNRTRGQFSKFLKKFGRRIQYSVFEIKNSDRILKNIMVEIECKYQKKFRGTDSIVIFNICEGCKAKEIKYGYAKTEDSDIVFL